MKAVDSNVLWNSEEPSSIICKIKDLHLDGFKIIQITLESVNKKQKVITASLKSCL